LKFDGTFGTDAQDVRQIIQACTAKKVVLYAHGGLVGEDAAVQVLADMLPVFESAGVYPLSFIWHSDFLTTLLNILKESLNKRKPEGFLDSAKDFMLDRLDDALEPLARTIGGKAQWDEMKENALGATVDKNGGARIAAEFLADLARKGTEIHVIGHSAGSIFHAHLIKLLCESVSLGNGVMPIKTCTLWAPAMTADLFKQTYLPLIGNGIERFSLFTMDDKTEQDDNCGKIYNKSLLYLVSNAFEAKPRIPLFRDGVPILGWKNSSGETVSCRRCSKRRKQSGFFPEHESQLPGSYSRAAHGDLTTIGRHSGDVLPLPERCIRAAFQAEPSTAALPSTPFAGR